VSLHKRLERLEDTSRRSDRSVSREALKALSDEDLDALEEMLETALASGDAAFEDLYAAVTERGRRALHAYFEAIEVWQRRETDDVLMDDEESRLEELAAGAGRPGYRNAYRIWNYRKQ
jgi:hypothetical protein